MYCSKTYFVAQHNISNKIYNLKKHTYYKNMYLIQHIILYNVIFQGHVCLKDIKMEYKVYATYMCCIVLYTI